MKKKIYIRNSLVLGNRLHSRYASRVVNSASNLHPNFVTGFSDAESYFSLIIIKSSKYKTGWTVKPIFSIHLHIKDKVLLNQIQSFFGVGLIRSVSEKNRTVHFSVQSSKDIDIIISHFNKFPLITAKNSDFLLFKLAMDLIKNKEHLTKDGLYKILSIRASMNNGLTTKLKEFFPDIIPVKRPLVKDQEILREATPHYHDNVGHWFAGFVGGEGCFCINIFKSSSMKSGFQVKLLFKITQHSRDEQLMRSLEEYFNCGSYQPYSNRDAGDFVVTGFTDIAEKIIPFFKKYQIEGVKALDFADFCKVAQLMKNKDHLNQAGLEQIRKIKAGMNRGR
jgi:hypothetical protein